MKHVQLLFVFCAAKSFSALQLVANLSSQTVLYVTDYENNQIWQVDALSGQAQIVNVGVGFNPAAVVYDCTNKEIGLYWGNDDDGDSIFFASLSTGQRLYFSGSFSYIKGLAIDSSVGRMYYADTNLNTVGACDLNAQSYLCETVYNIFLDNSAWPRALALSFNSRLLFWAENGASPAIRSANIEDGSIITTVISLTSISEPSGLVIDQTTNVMFWCDGGLGRIESLTLNGSLIRTLIASQEGARFLGIAIDANYVYLTISPANKQSGLQRVLRTGGTMELFGPQGFAKLYGIVYVDFCGDRVTMKPAQTTLQSTLKLTQAQPNTSTSTTPQSTSFSSAILQSTTSQSSTLKSVVLQSTAPMSNALTSVISQSTSPQLSTLTSAVLKTTTPQSTTLTSAIPQSTTSQSATLTSTILQSIAPMSSTLTSVFSQSTTPQLSTLTSAVFKSTTPQSATLTSTISQSTTLTTTLPQSTTTQSNTLTSTVSQTVTLPSVAPQSTKLSSATPQLNSISSTISQSVALTSIAAQSTKLTSKINQSTIMTSTMVMQTSIVPHFSELTSTMPLFITQTFTTLQSKTLTSAVSQSKLLTSIISQSNALTSTTSQTNKLTSVVFQINNVSSTTSQPRMQNLTSTVSQNDKMTSTIIHSNRLSSAMFQPTLFISEELETNNLTTNYSTDFMPGSTKTSILTLPTKSQSKVTSLNPNILSSSTTESEIIAAEMANLTIKANESLMISANPNAYGNDVKPRAHVMTEDGQRTWLDPYNLPSGILTKYYLYIGFINTTATTASIRLQIWRPLTATSLWYLIVWEMKATVYLTIPTGALYIWRIDPVQQFQVKSGDHMGWTCENSHCPITYDDSADHTTMFFRTGGNNPSHDNNYLFETGLSSTWSVAVEITSAQSEGTTTSSKVNVVTVIKPEKSEDACSLGCILGVAIGACTIVLVTLIMVIGVIVVKKRKSVTSAGRHVHMSRAISSLNEYGDRSNHRSEYQQDKEDAYDELRNERYENLQIDTYEPQREVVYDTLQNKPAESESDKHTYATFVISDVNFTRH